MCDSSVYAILYKLKVDGTLEESAITSTLVQNGRYEFSGNTALESTSKVSYQVMIEGCDQYLSRPVTTLDLNQDVTWGSSLVGAASHTYLSRPLVQVEGTVVKQLIDSLNASSIMGNYSSLSGDASLVASFSTIFGEAPAILLDSYPANIIENFPSTINEGLPSIFKVTSLHFDPTYTVAYEWHLDGVEQSNSSQWTYSPSANSSGLKNVSLYVGQDNGSARVERTKPYYTITRQVRILNTIPATSLAFTAPAATNSTNISLTLTTGAAIANCLSFSDLLVTTSSSKPLSSDSDFFRTCTTSPTQAESFSLSGSDGTKTIYLWARDAGGNVSTAASSRDIILDRVAPLVSLTGVGSLYAGGKTLNFNYAVNDSLSGIASAAVYISYSAGAFSKIKDLSITGTADSFTLPLVDATDAKIKIIAIDQAGNSNEITSSDFTIDSTAPLAPIISRTSAAFSSSLTVALSATCTGIHELLVGEAVTAAATTGWISCASTFSVTLTGATQGLRTIKAFARDQAGNVSPVTNITYSYDNVIPVATINVKPSALSSVTSFAFQFSGTDNVSAVSDLSFECSLNGAAFSACSSPKTETGFVTGSNNYRVHSIDQAGNVSTNITYTWDHNPNEPTLAYVSVASLSPSPSKSLSARTVTVGGTNVESYKYTVIRSGACSAVNFTALTEITLSGNTTISFTPTTDGTYQICGIAKSIFGKWQLDTNASASPILTIDTVVPTLTSSVLSPGAYGTVTTPSISGVAEASSEVSLYKNSPTCATTAESTTTASASTGAFSLTAAALSTDGIQSYYLKVTDAAGNSICSAAHPYTLDRVNPTVALTNLVGGEVIKGNQSTTITWTASDTNLATNPITLEYSLNNGVTWSQIATSLSNSGTYAWAMPGFNSTTAKIRVTAVDLASNSAQSASPATFTIDSTAPILSLTSLTGGQIIKGGSTQAITWTASDNNTSGNWITLAYSQNGGTTYTNIISTTNTGTYSWIVPASTDSSTFKVKVIATDAVGQMTEASSSSNFIVDSTNPTVTLTSLTGGQAILGNSSQLISWTASDTNIGTSPITLELSSNSGSTWSAIASNLPNSGSYSWTANVTDGSNYRVRVKATDAAGLSSTSSSTSDFTVSTQAPNLSQTFLASPY